MELTKNQALSLIKTLLHYQFVCERAGFTQVHSPELLEQLRASAPEDATSADPGQVNGDSATESYVLGSELHDLVALQATAIGSSVARQNAEVTLEFECNSAPGVNVTDLLVNGIAVDDVTFIRRTEENELLVAERYDGCLAWHRFHVPKFPKSWTELLPVEDLIEIE